MKWKWTVGMVAATVVVGFAIYAAIWRQGSDVDQLIRVSGNIEVADVELSFKIPGLVEKRLVSEGEEVAEGDTVAVLDTSDLKREIALRKAELDAAKAKLSELEAGSRPEEIGQAEAVLKKARAYLAELEAGSRPQEVAAGEASVARATAELSVLEQDFHRNDELHKKEAISTQEFEAAKGAFDMARARLKEAEEHLKLIEEGPRKEDIEQARASVTEAEESWKLVVAGPRRETIEESRARVQQAKQALALAETRLSYATLLSPFCGVVLSEHVESGEFVSAGTPVVTVAHLDSVWLRAYINETDLGRVNLGQTVRVVTDTYPDKHYDGRITFISSEAEFTPKNVQTTKERVKLVYRIKIDIPNRHGELKPGMPADADIRLTEGAGESDGGDQS